jgi:hypothetical protein
MKELSRPTATLREEDTLIEISSRGVFTRIIRFEHRLPTAKGMRPARRTASQQTWHKVQNAARFSTSLLGLVCYLIIKKRPHENERFITDFHCGPVKRAVYADKGMILKAILAI